MINFNQIFPRTRLPGLFILWGCSSALSPTTVLAASELHSARIDEACWENTFTEDFDTLSLWSTDNPDGIWKTSYIWDREIRINNELQYYVDPEQHGVSPFKIRDGILSIIASRTPTDLKASVQDSDYISGVLTTENNFSQKFGRFDMRGRMPAGKGLWPAFWLLPTFEQWPQGIAVLPEIDVMEYLGHEPDTYHTTLHTNQTGKLTSHQYEQRMRTDLSENFHTYSVIWDIDTVSWYFDGKRVATNPTPADFTRPVHFLLNLAVGGSWPGSPDKHTRFPAEYQVDYVMAYVELPGCH